MEYDEQFLVKAADRFEQQAHQIVVLTTLRYTFIALLASFAGAGGLQFIGKTDVPIALIVCIASIFGALAGVSTGRARAFQLRVEVHKLLALVAIHRRTAKLLQAASEIVPASHA